MGIVNVISDQAVSKVRRAAAPKAARPIAKLAPVVAQDVRVAAKPAVRVATEAEGRAAYEAANKRLAGKYPTLDKVVTDPDKFVAEARARFAAQKAIDPKNAYRFDFSDYGIPVLKQWLPMLDAEIAKVESNIANRGAWQVWGKTERTETLAHLKDIRGAVQKHLTEGKVDYQRMLELGYYSTRAMGRFDLNQLNLRDKAMLMVDRAMQGYRHAPIDAERRAFKAGEMTVFDAMSPVEGFRWSMAKFEQAYLNPKKLEMITLPTSEELGTDAFMRLANHPIYLVGVTQQPVAADGFIRPSADFWLHDIRHNSAIFSTHEAYKKQHSVTPETAKKLSKQIDVWREELLAARKELKDPELKKAIRFFDFNYHHDRGYPMVPSSYTHAPKDPTGIALILHRTLRLAGQKPGGGTSDFANPKPTLKKAFDWLHTFWAARLPQEKALLGPKANFKPLG